MFSVGEKVVAVNLESREVGPGVKFDPSLHLKKDSVYIPWKDIMIWEKIYHI